MYIFHIQISRQFNLKGFTGFQQMGGGGIYLKEQKVKYSAQLEYLAGRPENQCPASLHDWST